MLRSSSRAASAGSKLRSDLRICVSCIFRIYHLHSTHPSRFDTSPDESRERPRISRRWTMWLKKKATASEPAQAAATDPTVPRFAMQVASGRIRALARNTMPLGTLALPPHLATSEQTLWLSAAFYGVLIVADRKSGTS